MRKLYAIDPKLAEEFARKTKNIKKLPNYRKPKNEYKYVVDNKMRGAYGEIDDEKKVIRINKKRHKSDSAERRTPNKDGSESLLATILHEEVHRMHPEMTERDVDKEEKRVRVLSPKKKKELYALFS